MTTTLSAISWLRKLCLPEHARPMCREPFALVHGNEYWTVATDGKLLVALAGVEDGIGASAPINSPTSVVLHYLRPISDWHEWLPLEVLHAWAGEAVYTVPCPACKGASANDPDPVLCTFCDGDGSMLPDAAVGQLPGMCLNRGLVARAIEGLIDEPVRLAVYPSSGLLPNNLAPTSPLVIEPLRRLAHGQGPWRVCVMPLDSDGITVQEQGKGPMLSAGVEGEALAWNDRLVTRIASHIAASRDWPALPVLADALEDAGCDDEAILTHLRNVTVCTHGRGCWVVDSILGARVTA